MNILKSLRIKSVTVKNIRSFSSTAIVRPLILGIETSCDDTGCALVDATGAVIGEAINSQQNTHLRYGGIIPPIAQDLHRRNIESVVRATCERGNFGIGDVDAIAVTNRPGLPMSLQVGVRYAKHLARKHGKPLIPIHHMEAHALAVRLEHKIPFPFLTLLISGGHCLLALVKTYKEFYLLGETLDDAPGEALDKISRRLKMRNIPEFAWMSGGAAIEKAAYEADRGASLKYEFPLPLARQKNCIFSFAGMKNTANRYIQADEREFNLGTDGVIPGYREFCLGFLRGITRHLAHRTQRAIEYGDKQEWFTESNPETRNIVISGGVACNDFIFNSLSEVATQLGFNAIRPSKKYCTDNGVMIAWNGIEHFTNGNDIFQVDDFEGIEVDGKCKLGIDISQAVSDAQINCKWVKIDSLRVSGMKQIEIL